MAQNLGLKILHCGKNLKATLKYSAPAIIFVGNLQLSVGKVQLPVH